MELILVIKRTYLTKQKSVTWDNTGFTIIDYITGEIENYDSNSSPILDVDAINQVSAEDIMDEDTKGLDCIT